MKIILKYKFVEGGLFTKGDWGHATILEMLMSLFIINKGVLSLYVVGEIRFSSLTLLGCPLMKHYVWSKRRALSRASCSISVSSMDDVLTSTKNNSQKRKLISSDISEPSTVSKKRKVAQGCHVCGESFSRNSLLLACTFK